MAKDFDIFLHRHLTECDLIIQSIPFRDGITVTDRMILDACLQGSKLMRLAAVHSSAELVARLDGIIKLCRERLGISAEMDASAGLKATGFISPANEAVVLSAENLGTLSTVFDRAETGMILSAAPVATKIAKSIGRADIPVVIGSDITGALKKSILTLRAGMLMDTNVSRDLKTGLLDIDARLPMDASLTGIFSRIGFDADAGIEMAAMLLGTRLAHSLGRAIGGIAVNSEVAGTRAQKLEAANGIIRIMSDMTPVLTKLIYPEECCVLFGAEVSGEQFKRHRKLGEMDGHPLADYDDMTLGEVDYVIVAE